MAAESEVAYMADPPFGEDRFAAGNVRGGMIAAGASTTTVALVLVVMRIFTRVHIVKRSLGVDDCRLQFESPEKKRISLCATSDNFPQYGTCTTMTYSLTVILAKLSLLFLYLRLSPDRTFRIMVMSLIGIVIAYSVSYQLLSLFGCRPVYASWDAEALKTATCVDKETVYMVLSIANIIMDVVILVLPMRIVIPLQMARRQKASVILLFATGAFVCAAAIKRTIILPPLLTTPDYSWDVAEQFNWSFLEANAGIVCASVPGLKPFFVRYLPSFISSRITGSASHNTAKKSLPYSTVIENNKRRRNMQSESYELQSQDDASDRDSAGLVGADDGGKQSKVWSGRAYRRDPVNQRETVIESRSREVDSRNVSPSDDGPHANGGLVHRSTARSPSPVGGRGIKVTQETEISYPS
ncbi:integral membrane protein [Colletotrichum plurivorum]|uniref:Integral membrane protein n=1 Tax=Colletotrichum plurivorum TaxID=2175906 RepID=A0A8H6KBN9_9PEZI|nr:integral membrane protein [Colletotrichum plurivorum]